AHHPTRAGRSATTHLVQLDGEPREVVCKLGGPSVYTGEVIEPLVTTMLGERTDLPVPRVLATGRVTPASPPNDRWALYERLPGSPATGFRECDPSTRAEVVRTVGSVLGRLHATFQYDRPGGLTRNGDDLRIAPTSGPEVATIGRHLSGEDAFVLAHGDLFPGNVLVDASGSVTGVIDWANAHVTTPTDSLARAELRFLDWFRFDPAERSMLQDALRAGYQAHRPLPDAYDAVGWLFKLLWLVQSGVWALGHLTTGHGRRQLRRTLGR
ncbi:MAG: phosphotransferase family protein, partial [Halobacteriota archaeon]